MWSCHYHLSFQLKSLINIVLKEILVEMNSFSFCLSRKGFTSPSVLNDYFARQSIPSWNFLFSFSTLNVWCHSLLTCKICAGKSSNSLKGVFLYAVFLLFLSYPFLVFNSWCINYNIFWCKSLWVHLWNSLRLLELEVCILPQAR